MRVISGKAKGRKLKMPVGVEVRPITDMIKEALFNILTMDLPDSRFLDLFSGSGSVGIEALSRGASKVVFVDLSPICVKTINENITHCGFTEGFEVIKQDAIAAIRWLQRKEAEFDLIYIDPPFSEKELYNQIWSALNDRPLLANDGGVIIRAPKNMKLPSSGSQLQQSQVRKYGDSILYFYKPERGEER
ncbi:MAG: 16S rRNA (guanine(966)-N(2))-methyltransferase RsmD [Methylocystaceae bacterium]